MNYQNEPKTLEDYKDVIRILKLKIIKQNKRIQELQLKNKNFEEQINSVTLRGDDVAISSRVMLEMQNEAGLKKEQREIQLNTLIGKVEVMNVFVKGLKKLGITPESVFRIADISCKGFVESDYFRQILTKIKLGLTQKQISCLIFIFDQSYSGFITREEYYNSLYAYKLGVEEGYHQYIHECIFKLSQMMHQDKINLIKFYEQMQGRAKTKTSSTKKIVDLNIFEDQIKKYYAVKVSEKEIVASFNAIDLESQGCLEKSNFLYTITSFINKLLTGEEVLSKKTQNQWSNMRSQLTEPFQPGSPTKKIDKVIDSYNQSSKIGDRTEGQLQTQGLAGRLKNQFGVTLTQIFEEICMYDFNHRLTLRTFKKLCSKVNSKLPSQFLSDFYKEIDTLFKGSIFFNDLINYYLRNSTDNDMMYPIDLCRLRLLGKYFSINDLNSEKFWFMFGLDKDCEITKNGFLEHMRKCFQSKEGRLWQNLWLYLARDRDVCNVGSIIKSFQKYECEVQQHP